MHSLRSLAVLQLIRLPTVFTAMADIFLGFLLTHATLDPVPDFVRLLLTCVCLYWTGMVMNDWFDRDIDAVERPGRPIPSGRIPASKALLIGLVLNAIGLGIAATLGWRTLLVAGLLTATVWLYDGVLKKTPLAPLLMGSCRFLNVMLGASASDSDSLWCLPQVHVAAGLGVYILGLTWFARQEAVTSRRWPLVGATAVINAGLATLVLFILQNGLPSQQQNSLLVIAVVTFTIIRRLLRAIADPSPQRVQTAIRTMLLSHIMLDASVILAVTGSALLSGSVASLIFAAFLFVRWIPMT